jgi:hypothetical protein
MHNWLTMMLAFPDMPIAIGELSIGGQEVEPRAVNPEDHEAVAMVRFRQVQRAVANDPALENITFVPTADYWDNRPKSNGRRVQMKVEAT